MNLLPGGWMEVVGIEEDWVNFMGWVARWPASKAGTDGHGLDMGGEEAENGVWCVVCVGVEDVRL